MLARGIRSRELTPEEVQLHMRSRTPQESRALRGLGEQPPVVPREVHSREVTPEEFEAYLGGWTPEDSRRRMAQVTLQLAQGADVLMMMQPVDASAGRPTQISERCGYSALE